MSVRIGITTSFEADEQRLKLAYVRAVEAVGGLPLIVPMLAEAASVRAFAELLDGLVITGGPAIEDGLVGALPEDIDRTDPVRTAADRQILEAFLEARKPILGICYGMQLLNAAAGGTLYADVERQVEGTLVPGSHLHRLLGREALDVNTRHVQAIAEPGDGFRVAARAPDGTVEAIESADGTVLGVQFHPERMGAAMQPLFAHLVARARAALTPEPAP